MRRFSREPSSGVRPGRSVRAPAMPKKRKQVALTVDAPAGSPLANGDSGCAPSPASPSFFLATPCLSVSNSCCVGYPDRHRCCLAPGRRRRRRARPPRQTARRRRRPGRVRSSRRQEARGRRRPGRARPSRPKARRRDRPGRWLLLAPLTTTTRCSTISRGWRSWRSWRKQAWR